MRILLVEDDPKVAGFIVQGLQEEEYDVEVATDGEQALDLAASREYDAILLDYMLPKRTGPEVVAELRRRGRKTAVIMLTARNGSQDIRGGLAAGVNDYLTKPFRFDELVKRLEAVIASRKERSG